MSEINVVEIRRAVKDRVQSSESISRTKLVTEIASKHDTTEKSVDGELDTLEKNGFIYIVNGEVKLP